MSFSFMHEIKGLIFKQMRSLKLSIFRKAAIAFLTLLCILAILPFIHNLKSFSQVPEIDQVKAPASPDIQILRQEIDQTLKAINQVEAEEVQVMSGFEISGYYVDLAELYFQTGEYEKVIEAYEEGAKYHLSSMSSSNPFQNFTQDIVIRPYIRTTVGLSLIRLQRYDEAEEILSQVRKNIETLFEASEYTESLKSEIRPIGNLSLIDKHRRVYEGLQEIEVARGNYDKALAISDRPRALSLLSLFKHINNPSGYFDIEDFDIQNIKKLARQEDSILVEYSFIGDNYLFIYVISPSGKIFFRKVDLTSFPQAINYSGSPILQAGRSNSWFTLAIAIVVAVASIFLSFRLAPTHNKRRYIIFVGASAVFSVVLVSALTVKPSLEVVGSKASELTNIDVTYTGEDYHKPLNISYLSSPLEIDSVSGLSARTLSLLRGSDSNVTRGGGQYGWPEEEGLRLYYSFLIKPIEDLLPANPEQNVIFVPDRNILTSPFAAFKSSDNNYLIDKHAIRIFPSLQALSKIRESIQHKQNPTREVLIVGNPTMPIVEITGSAEPAKQWEQLPGTEDEAKEISKLFNTLPLIGEEATEEAVLDLIGSARFIHLATHGILDAKITEKSLDSAFQRARIPEGYLQDYDFYRWQQTGVNILAFKPTNVEDGLLTDIEIYDRQEQLSADLVTLSACDTGLGEVTSDGVLGLTRPFIAAGVPSVVASLWKLEDNSSKELMVEFYRQLKKGNGRNKANALRIAMIHTREKNIDFSDPAYWGGLILIGESDAPREGFDLFGMRESNPEKEIEKLSPKFLSQEGLENMEISNKYWIGEEFRKTFKFTDGNYIAPKIEGSGIPIGGWIRLKDVQERVDLNNDGLEDALAIYTIDGGGSATNYVLAAILNKDGKPTEVDTIPLGDRVFIHRIDFKDDKSFVVKKIGWSSGAQYIDEEEFFFDSSRNVIQKRHTLNATVAGESNSTLKNVRLFNSASSSVIFEISRGSRIEVLGRRKDAEGYAWYYIYSPDHREYGWIAEQLIDLDSSAQEKF